MPMIFPAMDPWMEDPVLWPDVHGSLIVYLREQLQPLLRPRYVAAIEQRLYFEDANRLVTPDKSIRAKRQPGRRKDGVATIAQIDAPLVAEIQEIEVHESYIVIRDLRREKGIITLIELVSPSNKRAGPGRKSYLEKQREVLAGKAHLVEIDLLRGGRHVLALPEWTASRDGDYDYLISINRAIDERKRFEFYPCQLRERLPKIGIPLAGNDPDVPLDLQAGLAHVYEAGAYDDQADYAKPCRPRLSRADREWVSELIQAAKTAHK